MAAARIQRWQSSIKDKDGKGSEGSEDGINGPPLWRISGALEAKLGNSLVL